MRDITEYDGYKIETPYIGKTLTGEERKAFEVGKEEAQKKAKAMLEELKKEG